jgi:ABC-type xylose transport system substrate-binding protein
MAHKKGIRVVSYDRLTKNCGLDYYVSFDHVNVGEMQAKYLTAACPTGKYAIIGGAINDNNSFLLRLGQLMCYSHLSIEVIFVLYLIITCRNGLQMKGTDL